MFDKKMGCYCGTKLVFSKCCEPYLLGLVKPNTAETLMRSRYSAYASLAIDYIVKTTHYSTRHLYDRASIRQWAKTSKWQRLEVLSTKAGGVLDKVGVVEFKAYYVDAKQRAQVHHEHSNFLKEQGEWFFVDGLVMG